jgi:hypothetical protein
MSEPAPGGAPPELFVLVGEIARFLDDGWTSRLGRADRTEEAFLARKGRMLHLTYARRQQSHVLIRAVNVHRPELPWLEFVGSISMTVAIGRGAAAIAGAIESHMLPAYAYALSRLRATEAAQRDLKDLANPEVGRLLHLVASGGIHGTASPGRLIAIRLADGSPAYAEVHLRDEPGTCLLAIERLPVSALPSAIEAVAAVLTSNI